MKQVLGKLALLAVSLVLSFFILEVASRFIQPIEMAHLVAPDRSPVTKFLTPGARYRQVSSEFDAETTVTDLGYRAPPPAQNPELVFLGDSFTFGWGLADHETFAFIHCLEANLQCANLGEPGSGTTLQVERLEHYLEREGWRPNEVWLFMMAMTSSLLAGNDLTDNYDLPRWRAASASQTVSGGDQPALDSPRRGPLELILSTRNWLTAHSNFVRVVKYHWGPALKARLVPALDEARLVEALALTGEALTALDGLASRYRFEYRVYLLHPPQDVQRGTHTETLTALQGISPVPVEVGSIGV